MYQDQQNIGNLGLLFTDKSWHISKRIDQSELLMLGCAHVWLVEQPALEKAIHHSKNLQQEVHHPGPRSTNERCGHHLLRQTQF
jgi:hypothetical protein